MKIFVKCTALLLALFMLASLAACGGDKNKTTTPVGTTPQATTPGSDDPMRPGDTTPDTPSDTDPLLPNLTSPTVPAPGGSGTDTPASSGTTSPSIEVQDPKALLEEGIRMFREEPTVRRGALTSTATVDGKTGESVTSFRFERNGHDFYAHSDSGSDTSDVTVVGKMAYVRIGDIVKERAHFDASRFDTVLYSATLSVLDALDVESFSEISGIREADGNVRITCRGVAEREAETLKSVLNTVSLDMTDVAGSVECVFVLDVNGRIIHEHCELGATVGQILRTTDNHTVELHLSVDASCEYPDELTILPPDDAASYKEVEFEQLFI